MCLFIDLLKIGSKLETKIGSKCERKVRSNWSLVYVRFGWVQKMRVWSTRYSSIMWSSQRENQHSAHQIRERIWITRNRTLNTRFGPRSTQTLALALFFPLGSLSGWVSGPLLVDFSMGQQELSTLSDNRANSIARMWKIFHSGTEISIKFCSNSQGNAWVGFHFSSLFRSHSKSLTDFSGHDRKDSWQEI